MTKDKAIQSAIDLLRKLYPDIGPDNGSRPLEDEVMHVVTELRAYQEKQAVDVGLLTQDCWNVFYNSDEPAPYNKMRDVIDHLHAQGYLSQSAEPIEGETNDPRP